MRRGSATQCYKYYFTNYLKLKSCCCTLRQIVGFCTRTEHSKGTSMSFSDNSSLRTSLHDF